MCLPHLLQRALEDVRYIVNLPGGEVVVDWDGDARAPRELGGGEVPLLKAELGAVEGLQVDGGEIRAAADPRLLEAVHHVVAHGITWTTSGMADWWETFVSELRPLLMPFTAIDNGYRLGST